MQKKNLVWSISPYWSFQCNVKIFHRKQILVIRKYNFGWKLTLPLKKSFRHKRFFWSLFRVVWLLLPISSFKIFLKRLVFRDDYKKERKKHPYWTASVCGPVSQNLNLVSYIPCPETFSLQLSCSSIDSNFIEDHFSVLCFYFLQYDDDLFTIQDINALWWYKLIILMLVLLFFTVIIIVKVL